MKQLSFSLFIFGSICQAMQQIEQNWSSVTYEAATHQYNAAIKLIDEHITDFSECYEILDIGCGPGKVSGYLASRAPHAHVHGIDKSSDMIEKAKKAETRATFDVFDGNNDTLSFVDQFDIIFSSATFHWIKNQETLFKDMVKSAAKNGTILIKAATMSTDHPLLQAFNELKQEAPWKFVFAKTDLTTQFYPLQKKNIEEWCTQTNLVVNVLDIKPNQFKFAHNEELVTWFASWFRGFPSIAKLNEETRISFITALVAKYAPKITNADRSLTHGWPQLILKATKPYRSSGQVY